MRTSNGVGNSVCSLMLNAGRSRCKGATALLIAAANVTAWSSFLDWDLTQNMKFDAWCVQERKLRVSGVKCGGAREISRRRLAKKR